MHKRNNRIAGPARARRLWALAVALLVMLLAGSAPRTAQAVSANVVISQVYGGGGNTGALYKNDFVELFNRGTAPIALSSMSVQYASATGAGNFGSNAVTPLSGTLAPGQYYLVQLAGGAIGAALPAADATGIVNMSGTNGKVALVNSTTGLACNGGSTPCDAAQLALIIDLIGYGNANFYETAPAPALTNTTAALRAANGCTDTDSNAADFAAGLPAPAPAPRNSASPLNPCTDPAPTVLSTTPANGATGVAAIANIDVTFSEPVNVAGTWFSLSCTSGARTATVTGGPTTFTLNPDTDFSNGDSCTLTVYAANVTDQDTNDPFDNMAANFTAGFSTVNACTLPYTPIYQIQGSGLLAAIISTTVTTQGVVVGDFEGTAVNRGFFIQDPTGDGDPATSDGIFVYTGSSSLVSVGQVVRVTGIARERFYQTTINGSNSDSAPVTAVNVVACGTGSVAPTDVVMPFADANFPERYEGMLVRFPQTLVIAEYFNYDRFGEIVIALPLDGESRPFTGTAIDAPGADANARTLANSLRRITLDDNNSAQNPSVLRHPNGNPFSLSNRFRGGDTVQNTVGVLGYDFNLYRIYPTGPADYTAANPRPAAPEPVGGSLRVAAMNTLNFFLTADYPTGNPLDNKCGPAQNVECRGWDFDQSQEFTRQRTKLLAALAGLNADIIGLNELENTTGVDPLGDPTNGIVAGLNALLGAGTYAYIDTGTIGTDAIRVGMIYKPGKVSPLGQFQILDSSDDPRFRDTKSRPALAQTFLDLSTNGRFTVVTNHFKSKGSDCNDVGDPDLGDGQGNCNKTRKLAAQALVDWLATDPTGSGDADFLIMGDLNSYAREDPISAIKAGPDDTAGTGDDYTNLISAFQGAYAYSYTFDGQAGYLDQALASSNLVGQVTGAADWHINSDEPDVLDYDTSFKPDAVDALYEPNAYRTSDHDAVVVGLNVNGPPTVNAGGPYSVNEGSSVSVSATGSDPNGDTLTYAWDLNNDGVFETPGQTASYLGVDGPAAKTIAVKATDPGGLSAVSTATVNISNVAPTVGAITAPTAPVRAGTAINASAPFGDPGVLDTHTAVWIWGDGSTSAGAVSESNGTGSTSGTHTYAAPGLYTVQVTVTDKDGGAGSSTYRYVVVYDPNAGFLTGGGWIDSPAGAYMPDPSQHGKATFNVEAKYQKGTAPTGNSELELHGPDFHFASTAYDWLVVNGGNAWLRGSGKINGSGDYAFLVAVVDGVKKPDQIRIWIWNKGTGAVIYDNQAGAPLDALATQLLGGGNLTVH